MFLSSLVQVRFASLGTRRWKSFGCCILPMHQFSCPGNSAWQRCRSCRATYFALFSENSSIYFSTSRKLARQSNHVKCSPIYSMGCGIFSAASQCGTVFVRQKVSTCITEYGYRWSAAEKIQKRWGRLPRNSDTDQRSCGIDAKLFGMLCFGSQSNILDAVRTPD